VDVAMAQMDFSQDAEETESEGESAAGLASDEESS
jgi:hypothetical protein